MSLEVEFISQSRSVHELRDRTTGEILELMPGPVSSFVTFKRDDGQKFEVPVTKKFLDFLIGK
jgi:hypothetical protein